MKLSVITVCYNAEKTIEQTMQSIQAQTYKDIEKVIIDGGSSDGTQGIVKKYLLFGDKFITEKDKGIYDAMNKGIAMSTGDIIYFLNADDAFSNQDVANKIMLIFNEKLSRKVVYGRVSFVNVPAEINKKQLGKINSINDFLTNTICHQAVFVQKELFVKLGGFNIKYQFAADQEWLLRAYKYYGQFFFYNDSIIANYYYQGRNYQAADVVQKEKEGIIYDHFSLMVFLFYWLRYVFIRGFKKRILRESW